MAGMKQRKPRKKSTVENPGKLFMRLMNYVFREYKFHCLFVFILIFVGVIANVQGTMFNKPITIETFEVRYLRDR